jgi:hypothetical protein
MSEHSRQDELERRLDAALDALAAEQSPPEDDDPSYMELLDTARIVRQLRDPDLPGEDFAGLLAAQLQPLLSPESQNGRAADSDIRSFQATRTKRRRSTWLLGSLAALLRVLGAGVIAGALAGLLAIGVGARVAMRISGALFLREHPGVTTVTDSSGQTVGVVTLDGTIELLAQAMIAGLFGGLLYMVIRPWLPTGRRARTLTTGAFVLCTTGLAFIDRDNPDFSRLGIPWLNVLMFASFITLFGLLVSPLSEWLLKQSEPTRRSHLGRAIRALSFYPAGALGLLLVIVVAMIVPIWIGEALVNFILGRGNRLELALIMVVSPLFIAVPLLSVASRQIADTAPVGSFQNQIGRRRQSFSRAGQLLLIVTSALGLVLLVYSTFVIVGS